jgi:AP endonuclease-1
MLLDTFQNIEYKNEWNVAFEKYLRELDAQKPVIWGGDFNCAPTEKDIRHAKPNWDKTPVRISLPTFLHTELAQLI